jgi:putative endonuclease
MPGARRIGLEVEDRVARFLQDKGYTILTRRYKGAKGEIDLVALDGETIVFVEVKFSSTLKFLPEEAINKKKLERMMATGAQYLAAYEGPDRNVRYDLVAIDPNGIRHLEEAFWL